LLHRETCGDTTFNAVFQRPFDGTPVAGNKYFVTVEAINVRVFASTL